MQPNLPKGEFGFFVTSSKALLSFIGVALLYGISLLSFYRWGDNGECLVGTRAKAVSKIIFYNVRSYFMFAI